MKLQFRKLISVFFIFITLFAIGCSCFHHEYCPMYHRTEGCCEVVPVECSELVVCHHHTFNDDQQIEGVTVGENALVTSSTFTQYSNKWNESNAQSVSSDSTSLINNEPENLNTQSSYYSKTVSGNSSSSYDSDNAVAPAKAGMAKNNAKSFKSINTTNYYGNQDDPAYSTSKTSNSLKSVSQPEGYNDSANSSGYSNSYSSTTTSKTEYTTEYSPTTTSESSFSQSKSSFESDANNSEPAFSSSKTTYSSSSVTNPQSYSDAANSTGSSKSISTTASSKSGYAAEYPSTTTSESTVNTSKNSFDSYAKSNEPAYSSSKTSSTTKSVTSPSDNKSSTNFVDYTKSEANKKSGYTTEYSSTTVTESSKNSAKDSSAFTTSANESKAKAKTSSDVNSMNEYTQTKALSANVDYQESQKNDPFKNCKYGSSCEFSTGVTVKVKSQKMCLLGAQYPVDIELFANVDVTDVVLTSTLPEGITYVSSKPEVKINGRELTWSFDHLAKGQTVLAQVILKTEKEGEYCACFKVRSSAEGCCSTLCAKPVLVCDKTGPEEVSVGDQINYTITVANKGSYPAENVVLVLTDVNAENKDQKQPTFQLGTIEIGKAKKISYSVKALKRGKVCYTAKTTSSNSNSTSCDLCTLVTAYLLESCKVGPKEAIIGQKADYQITVANTGDKTLHDMVITDIAPSATTIVSTSDGANISDKNITWKVNELKVGETVKFNAALSSRVIGNLTNKVTITNKEGTNSSCEATTFWKGRAALDISMSTSDNSIFVGENTRYRITVTNQGQEPDTNMKVVVIFPEGLQPLNANGASAAQINGQTVNFTPVNLALRQTLEYFVTVKAKSQGDLRPKVQVSSDSIKTPITQEESLIVN